ncbi:MAG: helix-turn-helix domain-containing protein [Verrucomicrobia bacterium]|nr:helix-turn-helix domain-containing protein [Verrucomicrobiota bacterium]
MQSIGERLEEARKKKGISIREAAEATKIRGDYLQQFENNRFDINLTEIYVRGFLRSYAAFLKLPVDKIVADYSALGRGEPRVRQPSREIYGRMDVSIASADDRGEAAGDEAPAPQPARRQPSISRGGGGESMGPAIDPALLFKIGKWAGLVVIVLLVVLALKAIFGGGSAPATPPRTNPTVTAPAQTAPANPAPAERTITLVALDIVRVTVRHKNADGSEGEIIYQGTLARGQTQVVAWPGPIYISASAGENLQIEYRGKRFGSQFSGPGRAQM